jgi:peptide deformylase
MLLKIARIGNPVLLSRAKAISKPGSPEVSQIITFMKETLKDSKGVGLAAPQVHVSLRLVIIHINEEVAKEYQCEMVPLTVLINPEITPLTEERESDWEGCLSLPGMIGKVPCFTRIRYRALTPKGKTIEKEAKGFYARLIQHECDHLDGVLYPMRMDDLTLFGFEEEIRNRIKNEGL